MNIFGLNRIWNCTFGSFTNQVVWVTAADLGSVTPEPVLYQDYPYSTQVVANGPSAITYTLTSGALPGGLTLDPSGVISGTMNSAYTGDGDYYFEITATAGALSAARTFHLFVGFQSSGDGGQLGN